MYRGQLAKFNSAEGDWGAVDGGADGALEAGADALAALDGADDPVPLVPHAARKALNPARVEPCRNRRRLTSGTIRGLCWFMSPPELPG